MSDESDGLLVIRYASGHDHCLEYISNGTGPVFVVSGAGKCLWDQLGFYTLSPGIQSRITGEECCYAATNVDAVPPGSLQFLVAQTTPLVPMLSGFVAFSAADSLTVIYYNQDGVELYRTPPIAPRTQ